MPVVIESSNEVAAAAAAPALPAAIQGQQPQASEQTTSSTSTSQVSADQSPLGLPQPVVRFYFTYS